MSKATIRSVLAALTVYAVLVLPSSSALAQKKYDPGATDSEIKIGNIAPYSGPASAYGVFGKIEEAYFRKVNDEGGVGGRKIKFISYDDSYSPPKAVEQVRQLFIATGATKFADPKSFPWTMGWVPSYDAEGRVYAKYILQNHPGGRI